MLILHRSPYSHHERQIWGTKSCNNSIFVEKLGWGDGVNLQSKLMPSVSEERAPLLAVVSLEQRTLFPPTGLGEAVPATLLFLL